MLFKDATKISKIDLKEFISTIEYNPRTVNMTHFTLNHLEALKSYISCIDSSKSLNVDLGPNNNELVHELLVHYKLDKIYDSNLLHIELCIIMDFLEENITEIHDTLKLSKTNILMNLYFRFLHIDKNGIIKNFNTYACADYIGCTVQQVKNNLNQLSDLGILWFSKVSTNNYTIWLRHFDSGIYQESIRPGSTYLYMTTDLFNEFIKSKDVDVLRIGLRQLINYDNSKNNINDPVISFKNIKQYIPTCKKNRKSISDLIEDGKRIFKNNIVDNKVIFSLKEEFRASFDNFVFHNKLIENRIDTLIRNTQESLEIDLTIKDRNDILQMTTQYGFDVVSRNFKSYVDYFRNLLIKSIKHEAAPEDFKLGIVRNLISDELKLNSITA